MSADLALPRVFAQEPDHDSYRPLVLDSGDPDDAAALRDLLDGPARPVVHDTIADQVLDLMSSLHPREGTGPAERAALARAHVAGRSLHSYGRWVHYPWSNRLVHVLPPDEFAHLRGDRNRYRITAAEQDYLRTLTIGVVGLSVGQATALTMSTEGVGGRFRLADFDALDLSNLNRLRAGVHELGISKAVIAARAMAETDPYVHVELFRDGLHDGNLDAFLCDGGALDLLVEECDDLFTKVAVRERARALRIPVLMETSDRGMVDVERFDLEPDRPVLHGLLGEVHADELRGLTTSQKIPYVLRILDGSRVSPELVASLFEVRETIHTWPQLASAVALGGAVVTDVARRLLLGTFAASGRFYVDLGELVTDATAEQPAVETAAPVPDPPAPDLAPPAFVPAGPVGRDEARHLVAHAALAPSGGNAQPWRFVFRGGVCDGVLDLRGAESALDPDGMGSVLALGAAAENLVLAAAAIGLGADVEPFPEGVPDITGVPDGTVVFRAHLRRAPASHAPELDWVARRSTNRRQAAPQPLTPHQIASLGAAAGSRGLRLQFLTDPAELAELGRILGEGDRLRFLSPALRAELLGELRWSPAEAARTGTGIDLATLELPATDAATIGLLRREDAFERLARVEGAGSTFAKAARTTFAATSAVGMLSAHGEGAEAYFHGGRGLEHVWLTACSLGLALHPYTALVYLFRGLERRGERATLARLRREFDAVVGRSDGASELMLFRLTHAGPPSARSARLPVVQVMEFRAG